ncbi:MAG: FAD:protein FMN transferase [Clostridium sp.]|nr:FAD:protein FMN transferase [Clostridium sp.]
MSNKILKNISFFLILFSSVSIFSGCSNNNNNTSSDYINRKELLMGTTVSVTIYDSTDEKILDKIFKKVKELEETLSINENGTLVDKINNAAGIKPIEVDDDTYTIIKKGVEYSKLSDGLFDISIGPIVKLWNIGLPEARVPTQEEINEKLPLVNYQDIELNDEEQTVYLKRKGMMLDLGGIAKGYTADIISDILTEEGVKSAIIDLGGNIFTHGSKVDGSDWKVGIQNPFNTRGNIVATISASNKSIVTSGIYERYIEENGKFYHHILSPFTGYPYENEIAGITIVSDNSIDGDALSTSVLAMGVDKGMEFVNNIDGLDAIFITLDNKIYITNGLKENFNLINDEFTLIN